MGGASMYYQACLEACTTERSEGNPLPVTSTSNDASGYVGEVINASISSVALTTGVDATVATLTVTPGIWIVYGKVGIQKAGAISSWTDFFCYINESETIDTKTLIRDLSTNTTDARYLAAFPRVVYASVGKPVYLRASTIFAGGGTMSTVVANTQFFAIRIA